MDYNESPLHLASIAYRLATDHQLAAELRGHLPDVKIKAVQHLSPADLSALEKFVSRSYCLDNLCATIESPPTEGRWWTG
ncbi:MAG TPA: hypothetical protein VIK64_17865 [Anaerolineales bacterium]